MAYRRHWRDYKSSSGRRPVKEYLSELNRDERADVGAAMSDVKINGLSAARHLRDDIYEVRAESATRSFRILFATEGRFKQVLLAVVAFSKKTSEDAAWADLARREAVGRLAKTQRQAIALELLP